jgi:hypothetical protein
MGVSVSVPISPGEHCTGGYLLDDVPAVHDQSRSVCMITASTDVDMSAVLL